MPTRYSILYGFAIKDSNKLCQIEILKRLYIFNSLISEFDDVEPSLSYSNKYDIQFFSKYEDIDTQNLVEKNRIGRFMIPFKDELIERQGRRNEIHFLIPSEINISCFTSKYDFQQVMTSELNKFTTFCIGDKNKNKNTNNGSKKKKSVSARELQSNQMSSMIENNDLMEKMEAKEDKMNETDEIVVLMTRRSSTKKRTRITTN